MKGIKKPLIILLVLILSIRTTGAIMAENGGADHIMPKEEDYMFSAGAITGLSTDFLSGLTDEQKQNIHLVIPGTINGQTVTSIAKDAFKLSYNTKYSGCRFVSLESFKCIRAYQYWRECILRSFRHKWITENTF